MIRYGLEENMQGTFLSVQMLTTLLSTSSSFHLFWYSLSLRISAKVVQACPVGGTYCLGSCHRGVRSLLDGIWWSQGYRIGRKCRGSQKAKRCESVCIRNGVRTYIANLTISLSFLRTLVKLSAASFANEQLVCWVNRGHGRGWAQGRITTY